MDDLGGAIQEFLAQPGAMEQLADAAKQLGLAPPEEGAAQEPALSGLQALLQAGGAPGDETAALLSALKPFVRQGRQEKLDRAAKALGMTRALRLLSKRVEL